MLSPSFIYLAIRFSQSFSDPVRPSRLKFRLSATQTPLCECEILVARYFLSDHIRSQFKSRTSTRVTAVEDVESLILDSLAVMGILVSIYRGWSIQCGRPTKNSTNFREKKI